MPSFLTRRSFLAAISLLALPLTPVAVRAQLPPRVFQVDGVAIRGYDPVSYFSSDPKAGNPSWSHEWNGATWHFASAENRARFIADPERYAPQYGGYCALGMAHGGPTATDPNAFTIHNDRLYLNASRLVRTTWSYARDWMISRADPNWQGFLRQLNTAASTTPGVRRPPPSSESSSLALAGLDPISYHEGSGPQPGDSTITLAWGGKTWRFRTDAARQRFQRTPERYAPQYDGFSALVIAHGEMVPANPRYFTVVGGRLFLELGDGPLETWRRNQDVLIARADSQWTALRATRGKH